MPKNAKKTEDDTFNALRRVPVDEALGLIDITGRVWLRGWISEKLRDQSTKHHHHLPMLVFLGGNGLPTASDILMGRIHPDLSYEERMDLVLNGTGWTTGELAMAIYEGHMENVRREKKIRKVKIAASTLIFGAAMAAILGLIFLPAGLISTHLTADFAVRMIALMAVNFSIYAGTQKVNSLIDKFYDRGC